MLTVYSKKNPRSNKMDIFTDKTSVFCVTSCQTPELISSLYFLSAKSWLLKNMNWTLQMSDLNVNL